MLEESPKRSRDDRKSARMPVVGADPSCELRVESQVIPAELLDESDGGFSVTIDPAAKVAAKQKALLRGNFGCYNVRVIYATTVYPKNVGDGADASRGPRVRLGLRKLDRAYLPPSSQTPGEATDETTEERPHGSHSRRRLVVLGACLVIVAALVAIGLLVG
jgi:hypothetical protein